MWSYQITKLLFIYVFCCQWYLSKTYKGGALPNVKLPNYQVIKSTWNIWYIDFEKENVVKGDPYQHGVTKLPSYFVYHKKHRKNCEKLPWEYLIGCRGVKLFLLKDVTLTTTVTTVTITSITIWVLSQFDFLSFVTILVFEFCYNLNFFEFCHNLFFERSFFVKNVFW